MSVLERIVAESALTKTQLETITLYRRVRSGEISLKEAAAERDGGPVSVGAYYRVVGQAKENVKESIMTLVAVLWMGYVKLEDLTRLLQVIAGNPGELGEEEANQLMGVLHALLDKIVM